MIQGLTIQKDVFLETPIELYIKMAGSIYLSNTLIITVKSVALRHEVQVTRINDFSNLEIEGDYKVIVDRFNKK